MTTIRTLWLIGALALSGCAGGGGGHHGGGGGGGGGSPPVVSSLSPMSATAGGPTFTLTINGSNFNPGGSVIWNGASLGSYTFVSASQVTLLVAASQVAAAGSAAIGVQSNGSASNTLALAINAFTGSACVLFGSYDFFFTGFDGNGPATIAGSFGVDTNGNITGEQDVKTAMRTDVASPITGGSCVNGATANEGTLTWMTPSGATYSYSFVTQAHPHPGVKGRMAASNVPNGGISGSGRFTLASGGFLSGDLVLGIVGADASGGRMGVLGRFTDTTPGFSTPGTLSAGVGDINDNGTLTNQAMISGTVGVPDAYSRSVAMLTVGTQTLQLAIYVLGPGVGFVANADPASSPRLAGFVNTQANAGVYTNGNLNAPVGLTVWGASAFFQSSDTLVGIASGFNSNAGTFNLLFDEVAGGMASLNQTINNATYAIASNGRGTASYMSGGTTHSLVVYLDDFNDGYVLDSGSNVGWGFFGAQGTGPFTSATIQATFAAGTWFPPDSGAPNTVGHLTFNSSNGTVSGAATGTYAVDAPGTTGRGTAVLNAPIFGGSHVVFYIGAANFLVLMGSDPVASDTITFLNL